MRESPICATYACSRPRGRGERRSHASPIRALASLVDLLARHLDHASQHLAVGGFSRTAAHAAEHRLDESALATSPAFAPPMRRTRGARRPHRWWTIAPQRRLPPLSLRQLGHREGVFVRLADQADVGLTECSTTPTLPLMRASCPARAGPQ